MNVTKRDGRIVVFNKEKIKNAIANAFIRIDGELTDSAKNKCNEIANYITKLDKDMHVEEIQNIVEEKLMASNRRDVAKAYIIYRNERSKERTRNTKLMREISKKLNASDVQNQNANVDEKSFGGRIGEAQSALMKQYALDYCMSDMARNNHLNNEVYIHDLDHYAIGDHNCLSLPLDDLLANGFNTRQTDVRPAQSVNTAFQLVAVLFQLQSLQQFGGVAATHLDWTMVPYVRKSFYKHYCNGVKYISKKDYFWIPGTIGDEKITKDKWKQMSNFMVKHFKIDDTYGYSDEDAYKYAMDMTEKEVYQAVEGMYHNLRN